MKNYFWIIICCCFISIQLIAPSLKSELLEIKTFGLPLAAVIIFGAAICYACSLLLHYLFHLDGLTSKVDQEFNKEI